MKISQDPLTINFSSFPGELPAESVLFKPRFKNSYAIIWFKQGLGRYFIDFKEYQMVKDSLIILSKDQNASFEFATGPLDYVVMTFTQDLISNSAPEVLDLLSFCIKEHFDGKQILKINKKDADYLSLLIDQLRSIMIWQEPLKRESMFHFLQLFLIYCSNLKIQQGAVKGNDFARQVSKFTSLLEQNFRSSHKVSYYTDQLNVTYNGLSRYTSNYCGKTPKELVKERVILEIKRLLSGTNMPIKEIAYTLGFDEPTNLVKYFKKYTGATPTTFRQSF